MSAQAKVRKRDGKVVDYQQKKINQVVRLCLINGCKRPDDKETSQLAKKVAGQVDGIVEGMPADAPVTVEQIQNFVEQQLMALGEHEAAKQFILYRAEHEKLRQEKPIDPALTALFKDGMKVFNSTNRHLQQVQALDKFARFRHADKRREVWPESVDRVMDFAMAHCKKYGYEFRDGEKTWGELKTALAELRASPSMRMVQMAGPPLERCHVGVYNCAYQPMDGPVALAEELYILAQGSGCGFSVESKYVDKWPRVRKQKKNSKPDTFVIPDTTEGWCDSTKDLMIALLEGHDLLMDYSEIRLEGTPLKTKGGTASGPDPLRDLHEFMRARVKSRQGERLTSTDIADINLYLHRIVQVGGVRRASGILLGDLDDMEMRNFKSGQFWDKNPQRNQANCSAVYEERPPAIDFMEEWMSLVKSGTGERGIFNRGGVKKQFPERRKWKGISFGTNPCGEVLLRPHEFCNLSIGLARHGYTFQQILDHVRLATVWGTIQSTMTDFRYIGPQWKENCEAERLLGVDILGHMDSEILRPGAVGHDSVLASLKAHAIDTNRDVAKQFGINASDAVTCGKPSGDSSVFYDVAPGFKAYQGRWYIRRLRQKADNPIGKLLTEQGVPTIKDYDGSGLIVLEFPCKAPGDAPIILGDQTAIEQLENWKVWKVNYTEHNPSVTVYVKDSEWLAVGNWVFENWEIVGGLSFMPFDNSIYPLAPYEPINEEEYDRRMEAFPHDIDWAKLTRYEKMDQTTLSHEYACTGDTCSL